MTAPKLLLEPLRTPDVMAAKLWLPGGSSQDPPGQRGAHQLLGSVMSRGCGPLDHLDLADLVEGRGAGLRCEAHEDGLLISLRCTSGDAADLMPLLAWMVIDPHLKPDQVMLERSLSLQALQRQREDPFQIAFDGWRQLVYGDHGYGHDPLGLADDLAGLDSAQLRPLSQWVRTTPATLAIAGVWPTELEQNIDSWPGFRDWPLQDDQPASRLSGTSQTSQPNGSSGVTVCSQPAETEQVVVMLGQASLPHGHPDDLALRLLRCHLGMGMSSLLFRRLREEHGVAYDVGLHHPNRRGESPFVMHASTGADRAALTLELLTESWWELGSSALSDDDLDLARSKFRGQMAHARQTSAQRAERRVVLHGLGLPDEHDQQCLERLGDLSAADLQRVAATHLTEPRLSLCGPASTLAELDQHWRSPYTESA